MGHTLVQWQIRGGGGRTDPPPPILDRQAFFFRQANFRLQRAVPSDLAPPIQTGTPLTKGVKGVPG